MAGASDDMIGDPHQLAQRLFSGFERAILGLAVEGLERWRAEGFKRFNDTENAFTAVVVGRIQNIVRERGLAFLVSREQVEDSQAVLDGAADPARSPRIDIAIRHSDFSTETYFIVECKRLMPGPLARAYVAEGMFRFKSGRYAGGMAAAAMIGYVMREDPQALFERVNVEVMQHNEFDQADRLVSTEPIRTLITVYESRHVRSGTQGAIRITHLFFDVQARPALGSAVKRSEDRP